MQKRPRTMAEQIRREGYRAIRVFVSMQSRRLRSRDVLEDRVQGFIMYLMSLGATELHALAAPGNRLFLASLGRLFRRFCYESAPTAFAAFRKAIDDVLRRRADLFRVADGFVSLVGPVPSRGTDGLPWNDNGRLDHRELAVRLAELLPEAGCLRRGELARKLASALGLLPMFVDLRHFGGHIYSYCFVAVDRSSKLLASSIPVGSGAGFPLTWRSNHQGDTHAPAARSLWPLLTAPVTETRWWTNAPPEESCYVAGWIGPAARNLRSAV